MKTVWKLQDAKSHFSQLVEDALFLGPQYVSRRGVESVVVLSANEYHDLISQKPSFSAFLRACPTMEEDFELVREQDFPRSIAL
jgi:antitoxin Phd